jgi:hypothetical protein
MTDDLVKRLRDRRVCSLAQNSCRNDFICEQAADRIEELEDQIAKALRALEITDQWLRDLDMYANPDYHLAPSLQQVRDTLAELKGEKDE